MWKSVILWNQDIGFGIRVPRAGEGRRKDGTCCMTRVPGAVATLTEIVPICSQCSVSLHYLWNSPASLSLCLKPVQCGEAQFLVEMVMPAYWLLEIGGEQF